MTKVVALLSLSRCPLFSGFSTDEMEKLLGCLAARSRQFRKNSPVFSDGAVPDLGVVLTGSVHVAREDFWGNRTIVERFGPGEVFGEAFSFGEVRKLPVSVMAAEKSELLLLNCQRLITTCSSACAFHSSLVKNLLRELALKNLTLMRKMELITRKTTREKLLAYLSSQARLCGAPAFTIPFDRQELADYLSVDRSAMSAELCRMRDAGILRFHKNRFELNRAGVTRQRPQGDQSRSRAVP